LRLVRHGRESGAFAGVPWICFRAERVRALDVGWGEDAAKRLGIDSGALDSSGGYDEILLGAGPSRRRRVARERALDSAA